VLAVRHFLLVTASMIGPLGFASVAGAQAPEAAAETLFREGREALAKGDYAGACDKFERSNQLDPAPGTRLNLGECEMQRGRIATAYFLFLSVENQLSESDVRAPIARSKREAAEKRVPKLLIKLPPDAPRDTRVIIRGRLYLAPDLAEPLILDPGLVELTIGAPNLNPSLLQVQLGEAKVTTFEVPPHIFGTAPASPQPRPRAADNGSARKTTTEPRPRLAHTVRTSSRKTGGAFLGVGIAGGVLGAVSGILTLEAKSTNRAHCDTVTQACDSEGRAAASRGQVSGILTTTGIAIGVVGISLGTYLLLREQPKPTSARIQLRSFGSGAEFSVVQPF
jgi:hypothetical protein